MGSVVRTRVPIPVIGIVVVSLVVAGLLLANSASSVVARLVQLALILGAFGAMGFIGLFLWRRGDINGDGV